LADIIRFPLTELNLESFDLTDDEKDRIVLVLQGKALKNPCQELISSLQTVVATEKDLIDSIDPFTSGQNNTLENRFTLLETELGKFETHTNILSGVFISYNGFPPNLLGRISIAKSYNSLRESLRKKEDGPCGVEEPKTEIFTDMFKSLLGYGEIELQNRIDEYTGIIQKADDGDISFADLKTSIETATDALKSFRDDENLAFFKAYNFVIKITLAQSVVNSPGDDFTDRLYEKVIGTNLFNSDNLEALKIQCQTWFDDSSTPPSDFSTNFDVEFALKSISELVDINLDSITTGDILQYGATGFESGILELDDLENVSGATNATNGQALLYNSINKKYEPGNVSGGGGGSTTFVDLTDTPAAISAGEFAIGNGSGNAIEFVTIGQQYLPDNIMYTEGTYFITSGLYQFGATYFAIGNGLVGRHSFVSESNAGRVFTLPDVDGYAVLSATSGLGCTEGMAYFVGADGRAEHAFITTGHITDYNAPSHFQAKKTDGSSVTLTVTAIPQASDVIVFDSDQITGTGFTYGTTTGILEVGDELDGRIGVFNIHLTLDNCSQRTQLVLELQEDSGSGYSSIIRSSNYNARDTDHLEGATTINGFLTTFSSGNKYRIMGAANVDGGAAPLFATNGCFWSVVVQ